MFSLISRLNTFKLPTRRRFHFFEGHENSACLGCNISCFFPHRETPSPWVPHVGEGATTTIVEKAKKPGAKVHALLSRILST